MTKFYKRIVDHQNLIIAVFLVLFAVCLVCKQFVAVNYDMNDYLPKKSASTVALDLMNSEYSEGIPNARVMVQNVTVPQALEYKEKLLAVDGVTDVTWLDDVVSVTVPLETLDTDTIIKADVTDFEMDSAAINGVRLNMDINVDDSELTDKVDELVSAVDELNDGASEVRDGTGELYDATGTLSDKVGELNSGVGSLTDGAGELSSGLTSITEKNGQLTDAAYTAYEGLCTAASAALNNQLQANGFGPVTLTPSDYSDVLGGLLRKTDADSVYKEAYQTAQREVTKQVEAQADELYLGYIRSQADSIYPEYVTSQADAIYAQAASQAVCEQLIKSGYTEELAAAFLQTAEGKAAAAQAVKELTDEQKAEIREAYIRQMMTSEDVTSQIEAATAAADDAAKQINDLKGQLDSYGEFYRGLIDYTDAVGDASEGADMLKMNMDTLYGNTGTLEGSVSELNDAVGELYDGTKELADGTSEFVDKTSDTDIQISDEIDSI